MAIAIESIFVCVFYWAGFHPIGKTAHQKSERLLVANVSPELLPPLNALSWARRLKSWAEESLVHFPPKDADPFLHQDCNRSLRVPQRGPSRHARFLRGCPTRRYNQQILRTAMASSCCSCCDLLVTAIHSTRLHAYRSFRLQEHRTHRLRRRADWLEYWCRVRRRR